MARPPLTLGKLISRQANNIEETPEGNLSTPSLEARGKLIPHLHQFHLHMLLQLHMLILLFQLLMKL